jgi:DNA-binding cell septation regulator SpoVG
MTESGLYSTTLNKNVKGQPFLQLVHPMSKDRESTMQHNAEKYSLEHHI